MSFRFLLLVLLCAFPILAHAQTAPAPSLSAQGLFPFALPWDDGAPGPTDVSFLNTAPAGVNGFLSASGENFVDERGQVVRLWGVNLNFGGAFPDHDQAAKIAARLAKFGFNAVRFHHIDGLPAPGGLWKANANGKLLWPNEFDPAQFERLDFFIAELIKRGVYIDFNLHVARKATERDGFLDAAKLPEKDKGIPYFDARLDERNRDFARHLLTHVNPYTARAYNAEPGVCAVEVDNESSLLQGWLDGKLDDLPPTYAESLRSGWNDWARAKYGQDETMRHAWTELDRPRTGPELLLPAPTPTPIPTPTPRPTPISVSAALAGAPPPFPITPTLPEMRGIVAPTLDDWQLVTSGGARGAVFKDELAGPAVEGIVQPGLSVRLDAAGSVSWGFQLARDGLQLESGKIYTLTFAARSPNGRRISVNLWETRHPFKWLGVKQSVRITDDWGFYQLAFRPVGAEPGFVRLAFDLGNLPGSVQLGALSLRSGGHLAAPANWSLRGNLPLVDAQDEPVFAVRRDFARYLGELETKHTLKWRSFLRGDLKVRVPIWQTQAQFGGWGGALRERDSDALDIHVYWKHPEFLGAAWDGTNWRVGNQSMAASPDSDPLVAYSLARNAGKPLVVTEWNSGQPNDYGAETLLMAASHAAHQGWAGVWMFDYHSNGAWSRTNFEGFFSIDSNPVKMATAPLAALLFRRGDVATSTNGPTLTIPAVRAWDELARAPFGPTMQPFVKTWSQTGMPRDAALSERTGWTNAPALFPTPSRSSLDSENAPAFDTEMSDTGEITRDDRGWSLDTPRAKAFAGFFGGRRFKWGEIEAWFPASNSAQPTWAAGGVAAMDDQPIATSKRLLLVVCGRAENLNMGWNAARDSVGGNWGQGPTFVASPPAIWKVRTDAPEAHVWALDQRGQRRGVIPSTLHDGALKFSTSDLWRSPWYEIALGKTEKTDATIKPGG